MIRSESLRCRTIFVAALLLSLSVTCNWVSKSRLLQKMTPADKHNIVQQFVPERLRSFVAALYWSRADLLMHRGPFPGSGQKYQAGSYSGNSDIVPLLQFVIALAPEELAPYQLLARCLASLPGQIEAGLKVLQQGAMANPENPALHEMYAAIAWLKLFSGPKPGVEIMRSAAKYLEKAVTLFGADSLTSSSDPAFNSKAYQILLARLYLELNQPDKALYAWESSGHELVSADDRLASILAHYRDNGVLPEVSFPPFLSEPDSSQSSKNFGHEQAHDHKHDADCGCLNKSTEKNDPLPSPVSRVITAGLLLCLTILLQRSIIRG